MHTQDIAFVVLMRLLCANCSHPVTFACLRQIDLKYNFKNNICLFTGSIVE